MIITNFKNHIFYYFIRPLYLNSSSNENFSLLGLFNHFSRKVNRELMLGENLRTDAGFSLENIVL